MDDYFYYELLIYGLPPDMAPSCKNYKSDNLKEALKDFEFVKEFDNYISIYLMKITIKEKVIIRERIKEYNIEKWKYSNDSL